MAKGLLDQLEFDTGSGLTPDIALATGIIYAIAYEGPGDDIWVKTVSVSSAGVISAVLHELEIDSGTCRTPRIIQLASGYLAIVYTGTGSDGHIATISVDGSGVIAIVDSWEFDASYGYTPYIVNISGTTYAITYQGATAKGYIKTLTISNTGTITKSWLDTLQFIATSGQDAYMTNVAGDIWAFAYRGASDVGVLATVDIDAGGNIGAALIDTFTYAAPAGATGHWPMIIHISGTIYAVTYVDKAPAPDTVELFTIDIDAAGNIAAAVTDSTQISANGGGRTNIGLYDTNVYLITYHVGPTSGNLTAVTIAIADDGTIGAVADTLAIATSYNNRQLESAVSKIWVLVSQGSGSDGFVYTMGVLPTVTTQAMTSVSAHAAIGNGNVTSLGVPNPMAHGHCWNTTGAPTIADNYVDNGAKGATGAFTSGLTDLLSGTTYYIRSYASNGDTVAYGNQVQFLTIGPVAPGKYSKFWAWVDWNGDGDYGDTYDVITSDVIEVPLITYGKERELAAVVSASIQVVVDNYAHKYSPPNASSVLNQGGRTLRPGHSMMVGASFPWDEFTDADSVTLTNHTVQWDSSYAWTEQSGSWLIDTNQVREAGGGGGIATLDFEEPNAQVQVTFKKGADDDGILVLRFSDTSNYLYIRTTATDLELRKVEAGADTLLDGETFAWAVGATKTVKVVLHGEFIWVIVDLTQVVPATRRAAGALLSSTFNETETEHGIGGPSTHADSRWDNFGGVYPLFAGTIDNIVPMPSKERQTALITGSDDLKILHRTKFYRRAYAYGGYPAGMKAYVEEVLNQFPVYVGYGELLDWGEDVNTNPNKSWWDITGLDIAHMIEKEENGFFYQDQDRLWRFEAKGHRAASPHDAARCTLYDTYATNNLAFSNLKWDSGERDVRNLVSVHVEQSILSKDTTIGAAGTDGAVVWRCKEADVVDDPNVASSALVIPASDSVVIYFETKDYDTVKNLVTPTVTPDVYKIEAVITNGTFEIGETVTGDVSGNTGEVMEEGSGYIILGNCSGAFNVADSFTGSTSLATMTGGAATYVIKGTIANGPFVIGENVTTNVSGNTGEVQIASSLGIILVQCSGAFNAGDTFTGGTSGATLNGGPTRIQYGVTITLIKDYQANASADGSGADKTANLTVALAFPFYNSYGKGGKLTLTNSDTSPIYVTRLLVRGRGYELQPRGSVFAEDATSQADYGEQSEDIDAKMLLTLAEAQTLADDIETKEDNPRAKVVIEMQKGTKENLIKMLSLKLSDRLTLNYSSMGLNEDFYINKMECRLAEGGLDFSCALILEEVS